MKDFYNYRNEIHKLSNAIEIRRIDNMELYKITEGAYECLKFDVNVRYEKGYKYHIPFAVLKDKSGICFKVPAVKIPIGSSYLKTYCQKFDDYFVLKEEADSIKSQKKEEEQKQEIFKKNKQEVLTKEYGKIYADFLIDKDEKTIERFRNLAKNYGKQNAKSIINGNVRIGWSKAMCKESWGKPDKINTTTGSWGVHEQWVYEYYDEHSYDIFCLYFENGILTTIQE